MTRAVTCSLVLAAVAALGGCGKTVTFAQACREADERAVRGALAGAPARVELPGGVRLSTCVETAVDPGDLPRIGAVLTSAGDRLERTAPRDPRAALQLGYLVAASLRGASRTNGVGDELGNRLAHLFAADEATPAARSAYERGRREGQARG